MAMDARFACSCSPRVQRMHRPGQKQTATNGRNRPPVKITKPRRRASGMDPKTSESCAIGRKQPSNWGTTLHDARRGAVLQQFSEYGPFISPVTLRRYDRYAAATVLSRSGRDRQRALQSCQSLTAAAGERGGGESGAAVRLWQLCSGCGHCAPGREVTLIGTMRSCDLVAADSVKVGCTRYSGRRPRARSSPPRC